MTGRADIKNWSREGRRRAEANERQAESRKRMVEAVGGRLFSRSALSGQSKRKGEPAAWPEEVEFEATTGFGI